MQIQEADVIVIGGGIAGLCAAVRSAQQGLKVVVLERLKDDLYVCNSRLTGGVFHLALNDVRKTPDELVQAIMESTANTADPDQAYMLASNAKPVIDWLQSLGVRFVRGVDPWHSYLLAPPGIAALGRQWKGRAGDVLLRNLEDKLTGWSGQVRRGCEARRLIMESQRCVGVEADTPQGPVAFRSKAVVLADGGFQADKDKLAKHITPHPDKVVQRNAGSGLGACLRMAQEVGAAISDLSGFYGHVLSRDALTNDNLWPYPWLDELLKYFIVVGLDGRRFADEGRGGVHVANVMARLAQPDSTFVICDEPGWQTGGKERFLPPNPNFEKAGATVIRADNLADLAAKAGIDAAALQAEVAAYNQAIDSSTLESLKPDRSTRKCPAHPIRTGPFYALPASTGITYTMGGVLIDAHTRVRTPSGGTIEGLYAAGSTTGGVEGGPNGGYVGGLAKAAITGFVCGEHLTR
jgi:fumarate reductase flavoprotein subunit